MPPVVDDMELWEVAVVLGKAMPPQTVPPAQTPQQEHTQLKQRQSESARRRYENIRRRKAGLPELPDEDDGPHHLDPALATLIPTNAPDLLR